MSQLNPSITSPRSGARSRNRPPSDLTGRRHEALLREQEAKRKVEQAGPVDLDALRKTSFMAGWDTGYDAGYNAAVRQFRAEDEASEAGEETAE